jgi:hypothetical protein
LPDDSAPGQAADPEREVEGQRAGRDRLDPDVPPLAQLHDRALAELLLDLAERHLEGLVAVHLEPLSAGAACGCRSGKRCSERTEGV